MQIGQQVGYSPSMAVYSIELIKDIQSKSTTFSIYFFKIVSDFGISMVYIEAVLPFLFFSRIKGFYYVLNVSITLFIMSVSKMAFHAPRPYMLDDDIDVHDCSVEYGLPSGHAFGNSASILVFLLDNLNSIGNLANKIIVCVGSAIFILLNGYSRLANGVHSLDQVLLGWQFGILQSVIMHYSIRKKLSAHLQDIYANGKTISQDRYLKYHMITIFAFIAGILSIFGTYIIIEKTFTPPTLWITRLHAKCEADSLWELNPLSLIQSGVFCLGIFGYLGCLLSGSTQTHANQVIWQRLIALILLLLPAGVIQIYNFETNSPYIESLQISYLPCAYAGFVMFYLMDKVSQIIFGSQSTNLHSGNLLSLSELNIKDYIIEIDGNKQNIGKITYI
ncbi:pap2 superfamily phosphatase [Stylonychia lemnae]|uniref:Pap2 superfamily phosphatase n=1 Tax=Stylonychia lemnae TaxID=5949 RepID=A0A078A111_STYLE|nr:pap2 superfamily phosphatase [Stylonychia lemnae]|eukprot:CDW75901.1 pap2 superfamily phosphatase [Stylonychia lemnae]